MSRSIWIALAILLVGFSEVRAGQVDVNWDEIRAQISAACGDPTKDPEICRAAAMEARKKVWPASRATQAELNQPCTPSDFDIPKSKSKFPMSSQIATKRYVVQWGAGRFGARVKSVGCEDNQFSLAQWQRAMDLPPTADLNDAEIQASIDLGTRAAPLQKILADAESARAQAEANQNLAASEREQQQLEARKLRLAAMYAGGPKVFGIQFGAPASAIYQCPKHTEIRRSCTPSGRMCYDDPVEITDYSRSCFEASSAMFQFSKEELPGWMRRRTFSLILDDERVVGMNFVFPFGNMSVAMKAMDLKLGAHKIIQIPHHVAEHVNCSNGVVSSNCYKIPARDWIEEQYSWASDGLSALLRTDDKGSVEDGAAMTIKLDVFEQVKKERAEIASERAKSEKARKVEQGRPL